MNELADQLSCNAQLFADDTSLFSVSHNIDELINDLAKISHGVQKWKTSFNPDPSKQGQEVIFSSKVNNYPHPPLTFNNNMVYQATSKKHLSRILDNSFMI